MKNLTLILTMIGIIANAYSQSTLVWSEDFTTGISNYYSEYPTIQTEADTIKVIGRKNTSEGQRLLIIKYNMNGDTISAHSYGNDSVANNTLIDYKFDSFNHVYLLQKEQLEFYKSKIVLQKYSLGGSLVWTEEISNPSDTSYTPRSLELANDTCFFVTAYKEYDYPEPGDDVINTISLPYLYVFNVNGNQLWKREFDPNTEISWFAYGIFVHDNTAFLFGNGNRLVKVDLDNNITVNSNTGLENGINNVQLTSDNNLLISALSKYRISKSNLTGTVLWSEYYGTNLPSNVSGDEIKATIQDSNGNIYITGRHYGDEYGTSNYSNADILTVKYDNSGNLIWQNRYEYGINNADIGNTIVLKNGQIYVGGNSQRLGQGTDYDYVVLKIDSLTGVSTGIYRYNGIANGDDAISSLFIFDNGNVALTGLSFNNSNFDWTTQLLSDVVLSVQNISSENNFQVYPNPTKSGEVITILGQGIISYSIISSLGQVIQHGTLGANDLHSVRLDNISTGMYLLYLRTDKEIMTRKIIMK